MLSADVWGVERSHAAVEPPANFALRGLASPRTRRVESKRPPTRDGLSTPVGPAGMHLSAPTPPCTLRLLVNPSACTPPHSCGLCGGYNPEYCPRCESRPRPRRDATLVRVRLSAEVYV